MNKNVEILIKINEKREELRQEYLTWAQKIHRSASYLSSAQKKGDDVEFDRLTADREYNETQRQIVQDKIDVFNEPAEHSLRFKGHLVDDSGDIVQLPVFDSIPQAIRSREYHRSRMVKSGVISEGNGGMFKAATRFIYHTFQKPQIRKQRVGSPKKRTNKKPTGS